MSIRSTVYKNLIENAKDDIKTDAWIGLHYNEFKNNIMNIINSKSWSSLKLFNKNGLIGRQIPTSDVIYILIRRDTLGLNKIFGAEMNPDEDFIYCAILDNSYYITKENLEELISVDNENSLNHELQHIFDKKKKQKFK